MKTDHLLPYRKLLKLTGLFCFLLFFVLVIFVDLLLLLRDNTGLLDFGSFYASGVKLNSGENPYNSDSEYIFDIEFSKVGAGGKMVNLNPPISVMFFAVLAKFDPYGLFPLWRLFSAVFYCASILLVANFYRNNLSPVKFIWAFMLAGFWQTLELGQIYTVLLFFTALGWVFLQEKKYVMAGVAIGLVVAIKPNFLLWPLFLLFSGYTTTFLSSLLTGLLVSLIPIFFHGVGIYIQWMEASTLQQATLIMPGNNSILGLLARFNSLSIGVVISVLAVIGLLALSRLGSSKTMEQLEYVSSLGIIASLLASPIAWTGYTILLLPIYFSLPRWNPAVIVSAVILTIPFQIVLQFFQTSHFNFVVFGWLYGWALLSLLAGLFIRPQMEAYNEN